MPPQNRSFPYLSVLLIKEQAAARTAFRQSLAQLGIDKVYSAQNGMQGLGYIKWGAEVLDVIVCDGTFDRMDGTELAAAVRASGCHVPILLITNRDDVDFRARARAVGVSGFLQPTYDSTDIAEQLNQVLVDKDRVLTEA